eukprot:gene4989-6213_t
MNFNIIQSESDKYLYKYLKLENGLQAILVSNLDPDSNKTISKVALSVEAGLLNDPKECKGLSHLLEHLFMHGSSKYPDFYHYVGIHDSIHNAKTDYNYTNFSYTMENSKLEESLDRLSSIFINPIFIKDETNTLSSDEIDKIIQQEINVVNSEYVCRKNYDHWFEMRRSQFKNHPIYDACDGGNRETLTIGGGDIKTKIIDHFNRYYKSNRIKICIFSPQPIIKIEELVRKYFSPIKPSSFSSPSKINTIPTNGPIFLNMKSTTIDNLVIDWIIPDPKLSFTNNPSYYVALGLLGHESKGSILSALKKRNLAYSLEACEILEDDINILAIKIGLIDSRYSSINEIISIIYQYIDNCLKPVEELPDYIFEEPKKYKLQNWNRFVPDGPSTILSNWNAFKDPSLVLYGWFENNFDKDSLKSFVSLLIPKNMTVSILLNQENLDKFQNQNQWEKFSIPYYNVEYFKKSNDESYYINIDITDDLYLPKPNQFLTKESKIVNLQQDQVPVKNTIPEECFMNKIYYIIWNWPKLSYRTIQTTSLDLYSHVKDIMKSKEQLKSMFEYLLYLPPNEMAIQYARIYLSNDQLDPQLSTTCFKILVGGNITKHDAIQFGEFINQRKPIVDQKLERIEHQSLVFIPPGMEFQVQKGCNLSGNSNCCLLLVVQLIESKEKMSDPEILSNPELLTPLIRAKLFQQYRDVGYIVQCFNSWSVGGTIILIESDTIEDLQEILNTIKSEFFSNVYNQIFVDGVNSQSNEQNLLKDSIQKMICQLDDPKLNSSSNSRITQFWNELLNECSNELL